MSRVHRFCLVLGVPPGAGDRDASRAAGDGAAPAGTEPGLSDEPAGADG